jgi:hypothetical protein
MVLTEVGWEWFLIVLFFIWLLGLTYWVYKTVEHYKKLVRGSRGSDLKTVLEHLLSSQGKLAENIKKIESDIQFLGKQSQLAIKKVGLVRFSPYSGTGGNQSFTLALLNEKDTGVILLSLHSREGTRIYIKPVLNGESSLELSKEEKQAVLEAKKGKNI